MGSKIYTYVQVLYVTKYIDYVYLQVYNSDVHQIHTHTYNIMFNTNWTIMCTNTILSVIFRGVCSASVIFVSNTPMRGKRWQEIDWQQRSWKQGIHNIYSTLSKYNPPI